MHLVRQGIKLPVMQDKLFLELSIRKTLMKAPLSSVSKDAAGNLTSADTITVSSVKDTI
jgi:hypothetical protein